MSTVKSIALLILLLLVVPWLVSASGEPGYALGVVESFPEELVGEWMIGGESYLANEDTELDQQAGDFEVGVCAFV